MWHFKKHKIDTSIYLYNLINTNPVVLITITLKSGETYTGKIVAFFKEDDNTIWQWRIAQNDVIAAWYDFENNNCVFVNHQDISTVQFANDNKIHFLQSL